MPIFLLGAGFNADAAQEAAHCVSCDCSYPLVNEVAELCFKRTAVPEGRSIEDLFDEAQKQGDYGPIRRLVHRLREADYYIASALALDKNSNSYQRFLTRFLDGQFVTFNYDWLLERLLFSLGRWFPPDGYGVRVEAPAPLALHPNLRGAKSANYVLHLHGTYCVRTELAEEVEDQEWRGQMIRILEQPRYDLNETFYPFARIPGFDEPEKEIIPPIPDKSLGLAKPFISEVRTKAAELFRTSDVAVAIGYSFNTHDRSSYEPLLRAIEASSARKLVLVAPDATKVAERLRMSFPRLHIDDMPYTFKSWAADSFPGV